MRPNPLRIALLRNALEAAVEALHHRRASDIPDDYVEDFVALDWLQWHGGSLRLTPAGDRVCDDLRAQASDAVTPRRALRHPLLAPA